MARGGRRTPPARTPPGGPGKFARRSEATTQPIREPDIDRPDLEYGDRQRLAAAQRMAPLPESKPPRAPAATPASSQGVTGQPAGPGLPSWLIQMPSNRPNEPVTAGLDAGAGPGSEALQFQQPPMDEREAILEALYATYGDQTALRELQRIRQQRFAERHVPLGPTRPQPPSRAAELTQAAMPELGTLTEGVNPNRRPAGHVPEQAAG